MKALRARAARLERVQRPARPWFCVVATEEEVAQAIERCRLLPEHEQPIAIIRSGVPRNPDAPVPGHG